jgi:hypothetical protein
VRRRRIEGRFFFFAKKKKQKTFVYWRAWPNSGGRRYVNSSVSLRVRGIGLARFVVFDGRVGADRGGLAGAVALPGRTLDRRAVRRAQRLSGRIRAEWPKDHVSVVIEPAGMEGIVDKSLLVVVDWRNWIP